METEPETPMQRRAVRPIRIMIVDDSSAVRDGLTSILRSQPDIEVIGQAGDGLEAIDKFEELSPDVILMDVQMPEMDGIEATRQIKKRSSSVKILVLTVHTRYIDDALAAGADEFLLKDTGRKELCDAIKKLGERQAS